MISCRISPIHRISDDADDLDTFIEWGETHAPTRDIVFFHTHKDINRHVKRYKCRLDPEKDIVVPVEQRSNALENLANAKNDNNVSDEPKNINKVVFPADFAANEEVLLMEVSLKITIDVLWEDGVYESNIDPATLLAKPCSLHSDEFFPAMYVYVPKSCEKQILSKFDGKLVKLLAKNLHFGIVKQADNAQKVANVEFYSFARLAYAKTDFETSSAPSLIGEERVSFYELKNYHQYNYMPGTLVKMIHPKTNMAANLGYTCGKQSDGTVDVSWYTGKRDGQQQAIFKLQTCHPWQLVQIANFPDYCIYNDDQYGHYNDITSSDQSVNGNERCYSPSDHDLYESLDFQSIDLSKMEHGERDKRLAIAASILRLATERVIACVNLARQLRPYEFDRSKLLSVAQILSTLLSVISPLNDLTEGCLKPVLDEAKLFLDEHYTENNRQSMKRYGGSYFETNHVQIALISSMADKLFDFGDSMGLLCSDMVRFKARRQINAKSELCGEVAQKSIDTQTGRKKSAVETCYRSTGERKTSAAMTNDILERIGFDERLKAMRESEEEETNLHLSTAKSSSPDSTSQCIDAKLKEIQQILLLIQNGMSIASAVLAAPSSEHIVQDTYFEFKKKCCENPIQIEPACQKMANIQTCLSFFVLLAGETKKLHKLPWFSYLRLKELQLEQMLPVWFSDRCQQQINTEWDCNQIIDDTRKWVHEFFESDKKLLFGVDDILRIGNNIGDSLCLAVMCQVLSFSQILETQFEQNLVETESTHANYVEKFAVENEENGHTSDDSNLEICPTDVLDMQKLNQQFEYLEKAPESHRFYQKTLNSPDNPPKSFLTAVRRNVKLLSTCLPHGVFIRAYEDRIDLLSCMIIGPQCTPYADALFFFDLRLHDNFPNRPPHVFYKSMCQCLNPNLYENGMVCLSLLGTWDGKETELWNSSSTLLQVFLSIQSLILVPEPYFNEPCFENDVGTAMGVQKSREYNETAIFRSLESLQKTVASPPEPFETLVVEHVKECYDRISNLLKNYGLDDLSVENGTRSESSKKSIGFELWPVTVGFKIIFARQVEKLITIMKNKK